MTARRRLRRTRVETVADVAGSTAHVVAGALRPELTC
jgi:hypothetical protein